MAFIKKTVRELTPSVIAYEEDMPPDEFETMMDSVLLYINSSRIFKIIYTVVAIITVFLPLFTRGRIFFWLGRQAREDFLNGLSNSRFGLIRGVGTIAMLPIKLIYYNQEKEMSRLGFDMQALKQDAQLRSVTRTRTDKKDVVLIDIPDRSQF